MDEVFECIEKAQLSTVERKFLRKRAVEVAAAPVAVEQPQPVGFVLECFEELLAETAALVGQAVGQGRLRRWMLAVARPDLVKRVEAMVQCRRWVAHPDVELVTDVIEAIVGSGVLDAEASLAPATVVEQEPDALEVWFAECSGCGPGREPGRGRCWRSEMVGH